MGNDTGISMAEEVRPSARLRLLYLIYLLMIVWLLILPLLVLIIILAPPVLSLFFSIPALIAVLIVLFWIPKFYKSIQYLFTDREVIWKRGVWFIREWKVPYNQISRIEIVTRLIPHMIGISMLKIRVSEYHVHGENSAELRIDGIANPEELKAMIMNRVKADAGALRPEGAGISGPVPLPEGRE